MGYLDNIPQAMRECKQWMLAGPDKAPRAVDYANETTYPGAKNNPTQRMDYKEARFWAEQLGMYIGFVPLPTDPFTIIDLDWKDNKVYDVDANDLKIGLYQQAVQETYVERSLSGKGVHIVVAGKLPHDFNASSAGVECYGNKGFVVMTGRLESASTEVSQQQNWLDYLATKYRRAFEDSASREPYNKHLVNNPPQSEIDLDDSLIASMSTWRNAANLERYFYGHDLRPDGGGGSEGDLALMQAFLKFTQSEHKPEAAMRMFMRTPRAKLREPYKRATSNWDQYLDRTLYGAKVRVMADEKRAKDFDMGAGSRAMLDGYLAKMNPPAETAPAQAPINMGGMGQRPPVPGIEPEAPFMGFKWLTGDELEQQPDIDWVVKGIFPTKGVAAVYGESGAGKSLVVMDMLAAIADGKKWFGLRTKQLPVSIFALEGEGGLKGRKRAWEQQNQRKYPNSVFFWDSGANGQFALRDADQRQDYNKKRLIQLCADLIANGRRGGVVVIDTLNQASDGADENSSRDMGELLRAMKFIQRETDSLVIIVHHSTKSKENQSMRGHSSLYGAMDGIIEVLRDVWTESGELWKDRRGWLVKKAKDGRDGGKHFFDMVEHEVGMTQLDGPITGATIRPVDKVLVDEQTGVVTDLFVGTFDKPNGSSGKSTEQKSGKQSREMKHRAGDGNAPPPTNARSRETYTPAERAAANDPTRNAPAPVATNKALIIRAAMQVGTSVLNKGKAGAPEHAYPAPLEEVLDVGAKMKGGVDEKQDRRNLKTAVGKMVELGEIGYAVDQNDIRWVWSIG
jgi:hypothetical protein